MPPTDNRRGRKVLERILEKEIPADADQMTRGLWQSMIKLAVESDSGKEVSAGLETAIEKKEASLK